METNNRNKLMKIGLATIEDGRLLVVRKRGTVMFILPGGKPECEEGDLEALEREVNEELSCGVSGVRFEGSFSDRAADLKETTITVRLYVGSLVGYPCPSSEIEELAWLDLSEPSSLPLAPSITNKILPHLRNHGYNSSH